MRIVLLQIEDRKTYILHQFMNHNKEICNENEIEYIFMETTTFNVPPYWAKIFEIKKIFNEKPDVLYVMWLDSDAFFITRQNKSLQHLLKTNESYSMIISNDMPPWNHVDFNAGSFIVKNDRYGNEIIDKWISLYNPENWKYADSKWTTDSVWAGNEYEQGSFVTHILNDDYYKPHILQLSYEVLNCPNCDNDNTLTVHLAGHYKEDVDIVSKCIRTITRVEGFDYFHSFNIKLPFMLILLNILAFLQFKKMKYSNLITWIIMGNCFILWVIYETDSKYST